MEKQEIKVNGGMFTLIDSESDFRFCRTLDTLEDAIDTAENIIVDRDYEINIDIIDSDCNLVATSQVIATLLGVIKINPPVYI